MEEDSSEGENPKKLQVFPTGRKHLVFCTGRSQSLIFSHFRIFESEVCCSPFHSVTKMKRHSWTISFSRFV